MLELFALPPTPRGTALLRALRDPGLQALLREHGVRRNCHAEPDRWIAGPDKKSGPAIMSMSSTGNHLNVE